MERELYQLMVFMDYRLTGENGESSLNFYAAHVLELIRTSRETGVLPAIPQILSAIERYPQFRVAFLAGVLHIYCAS